MIVYRLLLNKVDTINTRNVFVLFKCFVINTCEELAPITNARGMRTPNIKVAVDISFG